MSSDAFYALAAFVGSLAVVWIQRYFDERAARRDQERATAARFYGVGSRILVVMDEILGNPHPMAHEFRAYPVQSLPDFAREFFQRLEGLIFDLTLLQVQPRTEQIEKQMATTDRESRQFMQLTFKHGYGIGLNFLPDANRDSAQRVRDRLEQRMIALREELWNDTL